MKPTSSALAIFTLWTLSACAWLLALAYFATSHGHLDFNGHAVGRDFVIPWTAGHLVNEGRAADVFNPKAFLASARALFDARLPFHFWSYPPTALFVAAPLGLLGYGPAYVAWNVVGLGLLFLAARQWLRDAPRVWLWLLMASPAVATNVILGQNGFLTAGLMIAGMCAFASSETRAGVWFGLLSFKPQLGLLVPIAALAARKWWLIVSAVMVAAALAALSLLAFGFASWRAFVALTLPEQTLMMTHGSGPFEWMSPSTFMAAHIFRLPEPTLLLLQAPFSLLAAWCVWRAFRQATAQPELQAAVLFSATFVASPQSFNYDLVPLSAAVVVLLLRSTAILDTIVGAVAWASPLLMIPLNAAHLPLMPLVYTALLLRLTQRVQ